MFKDLIEYIQKEWNTIRSAPFTLLIVFVLLCYGIYFILNWYYDGRIKTLETQNKTLETQRSSNQINHKVYIVKGTVKKEDGADPRDITITTQHPPIRPAYNGEIVGLEVRKGPDGRLPTLSFDRDRYTLTGINLNDDEKVLIGNDEIIIRNPIQLQLLTPTKDSQR